MTLDEIDLPRTLPLSDAAQLIEACAEAEGLRIGSRGTLAQYPGCIHWHFKRGKESGTLEVTLLNRERRILLSVHQNRAAVWTEPTLEHMSEELGRKIQNWPHQIL